MTTLTLIAAVLGALVPVGGDRPGAAEQSQHRWPEGLLVGVYLGALGAVSLIFLVGYFR